MAIWSDGVVETLDGRPRAGGTCTVNHRDRENERLERYIGCGSYESNCMSSATSRRCLSVGPPLSDRKPHLPTFVLWEGMSSPPPCVPLVPVDASRSTAEAYDDGYLNCPDANGTQPRPHLKSRLFVPPRFFRILGSSTVSHQQLTISSISRCPIAEYISQSVLTSVDLACMRQEPQGGSRGVPVISKDCLKKVKRTRGDQ